MRLLGAHIGAHSYQNLTIFYGIMLKQKNITTVRITVILSIYSYSYRCKPQYIVLLGTKKVRFSSDFLAGAEGLEPSARGFGGAIYSVYL